MGFVMSKDVAKFLSEMAKKVPLRQAQQNREAAAEPFIEGARRLRRMRLDSPPETFFGKDSNNGGSFLPLLIVSEGNCHWDASPRSSLGPIFPSGLYVHAICIRVNLTIWVLRNHHCSTRSAWNRPVFPLEVQQLE